jgi:hypothetical protein
LHAASVSLVHRKTPEALLSGYIAIAPMWCDFAKTQRFSGVSWGQDGSCCGAEKIFEKIFGSAKLA